MISPFNKIDCIVVDKKFSIYKIVKEETFRDPEVGECLPLTYTKVPVFFGLKEAYLGTAGLESGYNSKPSLTCDALFDVNDEVINSFLEISVKHLIFLRDAVTANQNTQQGRMPIIGSRIQDNYGNYCTITAITELDHNSLVRRISYQKDLNKLGMPFQRKIPEEINKYYSRYRLLSKSHLSRCITNLTSDIKLLTAAKIHNDNLDAAISNPTTKGIWTMKEVIDKDGTKTLSKDLIQTTARLLKNTTDMNLIEEFEAVTKAFNIYD